MNTYHHKSGKAAVGPIIGIVIALALIITAGIVQSSSAPAGAIDVDVPEITAADHSRGNADAPVKVIEYSDLECPYCKSFHETMLRVFTEYGPTGKVQWVYRHFPLTQLHKQARGEAIATECAAKVAGPEKGNLVFWTMIDNIFMTTTANDGLDLTTLPALAEQAGANRAEFIKCYNAAETAAKVDADTAGGAAAGAEGTPYTLVISPNGNIFPINGAYPYEEVVATIEKALADN